MTDDELLQLYSSSPNPVAARRALFEAGCHYIAPRTTPKYILYTWGYLHNKHNGASGVNINRHRGVQRYLHLEQGLDERLPPIGVVSQEEPTSPWVWSLFPTPMYDGCKGDASRQDHAMAQMEAALQASGLAVLEWIKRDRTVLLVTIGTPPIKVVRITNRNQIQILNEDGTTTFFSIDADSTDADFSSAKAASISRLRKIGTLL